MYLFLSLSFKIIASLMLLYSLTHAIAANIGNETNKLALLDLKFEFTDYPVDAFSSWNDSLHFCQWKGVKCNNKHQKVTELNLTKMNIYGDVSRSIGNLSFLRSLDLSQNFFSGFVPGELGKLVRLKNLNLSFNLLDGPVPANISSCTNLINISLSNNFLKQNIPWELGSLSMLERLYLNNNNLTGYFPDSLGNLSSIVEIDVSYNEIKGEIPNTIGDLKNLTSLVLAINRFSGIFPPAIYNLSKLTLLALTDNNFHSDLRRDIGVVFPNIEHLWLSGNSFTGQIPDSLSNASKLSEIDMVSNKFTGNVPLSLGNLQNLTFLNLPYNSLGYLSDNDLFFLPYLANCTSLRFLSLGMNQFGGKLTGSLIANLSKSLETLELYDNNITGTMTEEIAGLVGLTTLMLDGNFFTGKIPVSIGKLSNLALLDLYDNQLTGEIPFSLGNLSQLLHLYVFNNSLEGNLPSSFANLKLLQDARFCHNKLNGTIPPQFIGLPSLTITLNLSHNHFTGPLPSQVENLKFLTALDVSHNNLSGEIPSNLGLCMSLNTLNMQNNLFQGHIPDLSQLRGLQFLDLSINRLDGQIPDYLSNFSLMNLNMSWNNFEGKVPVRGVFANESAIQVYGNHNLCGGISQLNLQPCTVGKTMRHRRHVNVKIVIPVIVVSSCILVSISLFFLCRKNKNLSRSKTSSKSSFGRVYPKITYKNLYDSTEGFSSNNLIGAGSFGTVYIGVLGEGELPIAVKVLNLQVQGASRSFFAECEALKSVRHRNLVRLLSVCSGTDYGGNDFKAFILPFMSNGSLDKWLHHEDEVSFGRKLNIFQRINIALDIASALQYLHHQCQVPIIHCDLKPSNVLLDSDLTAHVSDFGLARVLSKLKGQEDSNQFSSLGIKGTIGYTAPEYGMGSPVSTQGDVYSYGILLLELFTGRRPIDESFKDNLNFHNFVNLSLFDIVLEIINQSPLHEETVKDVFNKELVINCLVSVMKIGIACSAETAQDRINMEQVVHRLVSVKEIFMGL